MKSRFKLGDRVIVTRIEPKANEGGFGEVDYPKLGWTGTLTEEYNGFMENGNTLEWIIDWDAGYAPEGGDLIKDWMIEKIVKDWDE